MGIILNMLLEKINTSALYGDRENFYLPGIIDLFLNDSIATSNFYQKSEFANVNKIFAEHFIRSVNKFGFEVASKYGVNGIDLMDLLARENDDSIVYEISLSEFVCLPKRLLKKLLQYNLIVHDYTEAGLTMGSQIPQQDREYVNNLLHTIPNIIFATDNLDISDGKWCINKHLFQTVADTILMGPVPKNPNSNNLTLMPAWKPRLDRLELFECIYNSGLLDSVDWSLQCVFNEEYKNSSAVYNSAQPSNTEWLGERYYSAHPFVERFSDELPRALYSAAEPYNSPNILHPDFHWNYNLYIALETYFDVPFVTEKTFKGFVSGLPTVIYGNLKMQRHVSSMGFKCIELKTSTPEQQHREIAELIQSNDAVYTDIAEHNYNLITDLTAMTEQLVKTIDNMLTHF